MYEAKTGRFNAIAGALTSDAPEFIFPKIENGFSQNGFFTNLKNWNYSGKTTLPDDVFGTVLGYSYGKVIDTLIAEGRIKVERIGGVAPVRMNIEKLIQGRINFLIEERSVFAHQMKQISSTTPLRYAGTPDPGEPIFIAFSPKRAESRTYAKLLSDGMIALRESGELAAILEKYGLEDWQK